MFGLSDSSLGLTASLLLHVGVVAACCGAWGHGDGAGRGAGVVSVEFSPLQDSTMGADEASAPQDQRLPQPPDSLNGVVEAKKDLPRPIKRPRQEMTQAVPRDVTREVGETLKRESETGGGGVFGAPFSPVVALKVPKPEYPSAARREGVEGVVIVMARVESDGTLSHASVVSSSGSTALDNAALESLREATFRPATQGGVPVTAEKKFAVRFDITE